MNANGNQWPAYPGTILGAAAAALAYIPATLLAPWGHLLGLRMV